MRTSVRPLHTAHRAGFTLAVAFLAAAVLGAEAGRTPACPLPPLPPAAAIPQELPAPHMTGRLPKAALPESSGLARSPRQTGVFWTHNDSGNPARLFAVDATGRLLRTVEIPGAKNVDWEDLAADEQGRLIVGDIGDNSKNRTACCLYRLAEPDPAEPQGRVESPAAFRFTYPKDAGAQDAEGLFVRGGWAYVCTKEPKRTRVFRLPLPEKPPPEPALAEFVAESEAISLVTAADLSPDGRHLALLTYTLVLSIELPAPLEETRTPEGKPAPLSGKMRSRPIFLGQAEGLAWDGDDLLISCEQTPVLFEGREVWRIEKAK